MVENCSINVEFLENETGENTAGVYLLSIGEIKNGVLQIGSGPILIINSCNLPIIWGNDSTI